MTTGGNLDFTALETTEQHGDVGVRDGRAWMSIDQAEEEVDAAEVDVQGGGTEMEV